MSTWTCICGTVNYAPDYQHGRVLVPVCQGCHKLHPSVDECWELAAITQELILRDSKLVQYDS